MTFRVAVAVQNDSSCHEAVKWAIGLCKKLSSGGEYDSYKLYFVYAVAQNPTSRLPILDRMERGFNMEIHDEAKRDVRELLEFLDGETCNGIEYEFVKLEKQAEVSTMLTEFVASHNPDMFVVGSHQAGPLKKFILGSVSQYCVDNLPCPVVVVKSPPSMSSRSSGSLNKLK